MTRRGDLLAWLAAVAVATGSVACGEDEVDGFCDADDLRAALANASAGDEVHVGACRVEGPLEVPEGVTLSGEGIGQTTLFGPDDDVTVEVTTGGAPAIVRDLSIEPTIDGIWLREAGTARIERVEITATKGIAIGVDGLTRVELASVSLRGPITADNADDLTSPPVATETATVGLLAVETGAVQLDDVDITGFAGWGAMLVNCGTTWTGGTVSENLQIGVHVQGGHATLEDVEIGSTLQGVQLLPSLALVGSGGTTLDSTGLELHDNENIGLLLSESSGAHTNLIVEDGGDAAVWLQNSGEVSLIGAEIRNNALAGVMALASSGVHLSDVTVDGTATRTTIDADGSSDVGDGIHLVGSTDVSIDGATLGGNARVGLFIDLDGGDDSGISLADVDVTATGAAEVEVGRVRLPRNRGAIMQNGTITAGWDDGVNRLGDADANDQTVTGDLPVADAFDGLQPILPEDVRCVMGPNNDCQ